MVWEGWIGKSIEGDQTPPTAQVVMCQLIPPGKVLPESATVRNNIRLNARNVNSSSKFTWHMKNLQYYYEVYPNNFFRLQFLLPKFDKFTSPTISK